MMAKKRRTSKKKTRRKSPATSKRFSVKKLFAYLFLTVLFAFTVYLFVLDVNVRQAFEGKKWSLPSHVYARPLEVYAGLAVKQQDVIWELKRLDYIPVRTLQGPGTFSVSKDRIHIYSRDFHFWDGYQKGGRYRLDFSDQHVLKVTQLDTGAEMDLLRLDPLHIGGIYPEHAEDRLLVQFDDIPERFRKGLLLVEDQYFYQHHGVRPQSIIRAMLANIRAGAVVQGGSTITQQLVKNFYLTSERSIVRKLKEALMAFLLEIHYGKNEIFETYANEIYLGQDGKKAVHGFGLASWFYFQKPLSSLSIQQQALLVALVKGPSAYNPRRNATKAKERRDLVLKVWHAHDLITRTQYNAALQSPLKVTEKVRRTHLMYPAFLDLVKRQLHRDYRPEDLRTEGLRIFSAFDPVVQHKAEKALKSTLDSLTSAGYSDVLQGAIVVTRADNGEIVAVVGDRNPRYAGFNRALDAVRPVGSLIKPVVYLTALEKGGYTLGSVLDGKPFSIKQHDGTEWSPKNFDHKFDEQILLLDALVKSENIPTARLGLELGIESIVDTMQQLGASRPVTAVPALTLGASNLPPVEVAQIYQTIAGDGFYTPIRAIRSILNANQKPLQRYPLIVESRFRYSNIFLIKWALNQVLKRGTAQSLNTFLPDYLYAGKTGTTNNLRDSWFAGFDGQYVAVSWVGLDDNQSAGLTGAKGAGRVWAQFFHSMPHVPLDLSMPQEIEKLWIDSNTGNLSAENCTSAIELPFVKDTAPTLISDCVKKRTSPIDWIRKWLP